MRGSGSGTIEKAPKLIQESQKNLLESSRMHYPFCDDLGIKRIYHSEMGYQPKFSLFVAVLNPAMKSELTFSKQKTKTDNQEGKQLVIPSEVVLRKCQNAEEEITKAFADIR